LRRAICKLLPREDGSIIEPAARNPIAAQFSGNAIGIGAA
jgi:hypothetical protein